MIVHVISAVGALAVLALLIVHGTIPEHFTVDNTSVALLVVIFIVLGVPYIPMIRRYISELSLMGTTIKFRQDLEDSLDALRAMQEPSRRLEEVLKELNLARDIHGQD